MIPFLIWFLVTDSLKDFLDIYFVFNFQYVTGYGGFFLTTGLANIMSRISFLILSFFSLLAFVHDLRIKKKRIQTIVIAILFVTSFIILTSSLVYPYFFIVFAVFMIYGTNYVAKLLGSVLTINLSAFKLSAILSSVLAVFMSMSFLFFPVIPFAKADYEVKIEEYSKDHPNSNFLFFTSLCFSVYDKYFEEPAIKQFYIPNSVTEEMILSQCDAIRNGEADVVVYPVVSQEDYIIEENDIYSKLCDMGYSLYQSYESEGRSYIVYMLVNDQ
jgi:hypothetical protein